MPDPEHPIWKAIEFDQANVEESRKLLESRGLMALLERIPSLFDVLPREIEAAHHGSGDNPYVRTDASGQQTEAWDFILQVYMVQSAGMQFLHAVGHLLRGHSYELFGHVCTMIEAAGIAYLAKSEPDLGDAYLDLGSSQRVLPGGLLDGGFPLQDLKNQSGTALCRPTLNLIGNLFCHRSTPQDTIRSCPAGGLNSEGSRIAVP
jgi:hypothetical protein